MRRPLALALLLAAAALLPAAPASAESPRAAARAYMEATTRFETTVRAQEAAVRERFQAFLAEPCITALREVPRRARERATLIFAAAFVDAAFTPTEPATAAFVADLERVRTSDRALRSGRAAWRISLRELRALPAVPADLCAQLERWRASGYANDAAPQVDVRPYARVGANRRVERRLTRAVARLRALGVPRREARRFTGARLFARLLPEDLIQGAMETSRA